MIDGNFSRRCTALLTAILSMAMLATSSGSLRAQTSDELDALYQASRQFRAEGRYQEALRAAEKLVRGTAALEGTNHNGYATAIENLALVLQDLGRPADAEPLLIQSLKLRINELGPDHDHVGMAYLNLGRNHSQRNESRKAAEAFREAIALYEKKNASDPQLAVVLLNVASLHNNGGRYAEAEPYARRAVNILESAPAGYESFLPSALVNLGIAFKGQGRLDDAIGLYQRSIELWAKPEARDEKHSITAHHSLGRVYMLQGRWADAEMSFKRAMEMSRAILGARHELVAASLSGLGEVYQGQGRFREAEQKIKEAREMYRRIGFPGSAGGEDYRLAKLYMAEGKYKQAEPIIKKLIPRMVEAGVDTNPEMGETMRYLGVIEGSRGKWAEATSYFRKSQDIWLRQPAAQTGLQAVNSVDGARFRTALSDLVGALYQLLDASNAEAITGEAFQVAQRTSQSASGAALAQMSARLAGNAPGLGALVREAQDLAQQWTALDKEIAEARGGAKEQPERLQTLKHDLAKVDARLAEVGTTLKKDFPGFSQLSDPVPLTMQEAQRLLKPEEALLAFAVAGDDVFVWVVTAETVGWMKTPLAAKALAEQVALFRKPLDAWAKAPRGLQRLTETSTACAPPEDARALARVDAESPATCEDGSRFSMALAYEIYAGLLGPLEPSIRDKTHLVIVPSGSLTGLPFNALLTDPPPADATTLAGFKHASWLIKRHAVTVLPAVSSLKALRQLGQPSRAAKPFVGFGNPDFGGAGSTPAQGSEQVAMSTRGVAEYFRGSLADPAALKSGLMALPDTAGELTTIATTLAADPDDVILGAKANETTIKAMSADGALARYKIVAFATHGLVAGELKGLAEPAIALSVPAKPSEADDGLLTASEAATLKLDADWVILSACNTAAGGTPEAQALSGLARAFFYAGTRALLVSHWQVDSAAAVKLTTATFAALKQNPALGRSGAFRQSMLALIDKGEPYQAHPAYWAPFFVVGEGGAN